MAANAAIVRNRCKFNFMICCPPVIYLIAFPRDQMLISFPVPQAIAADK